MIEFPSSTIVGKRLPKEAFYARLSLPKVLKDKFVSDVERISIENSLTQETLRLNPGTNIKEILVLGIDLKKQEFDAKIVEAIAKQNKHQLVFLLRFEGRCQLAVYYGKLYRTVWQPIEELNLNANGFTLDEIWDGFLAQIALQHEIETPSADKMTIDERLERQEAIEGLEKQIIKAENTARSERQPKKRFELYTRLQELKKRLEEIKNGQDENAHTGFGG